MFTHLDTMRGAQEPARCFDAKDAAELARLIQLAVDIALPFGTQLLCSPTYQSDANDLPSTLHLGILPLNATVGTLQHVVADQSRVMAESILKEFPLRRFKGTTACGRSKFGPFTRDQDMSAHDFLEALGAARAAFRQDAPLFDHLWPPG
jgi:hypothetical protein